ncbi:glycosyltransferase [Modestobacter versicolor]|uniref:Glycosyltransferase involved in cell wall biosynthesis n=1 Tax=Modestobacter versicolor TaxID=429133 RepID=A0A323V8Z8_9ACTN|nr:glycosyltransferase [Modestobacter versicolor]MBB3676492.1 glycosyltransferase involved in cell wall biosynthesis [Modestobacter versicolor]PZA20550.1 hypothetical protein DMO24_14895 [Modestobacter versicolor]
MTDPRVSVLLVTDDHERVVERALTSIESQVLDEAVEVVVADDHSGDRTPAVVAAWSERVELEVRVLGGEVRLGAPLNRHRGIAACRGRYVAVLEGHDEWSSADELRLQVRLLDEHPELSMAAVRTGAPAPAGGSHVELTRADLLAAGERALGPAVYRAELLERLDPAVFETADHRRLVDEAMAEHGNVGVLLPPGARTGVPTRHDHAAQDGAPSGRRRGVVVIDDHFPTKGTGFRIAEYDWMLRHGVVSEVMTTAQPLEPLVAEYALLHPETSRQISAYDPRRLAGFECASVMFLNNAARFLADLERNELPFVLTLYPGGGLNLGEPVTERKLRRVLASPQLQHVITTQPLVTELVRTTGGGAVPVTEVLGVTVNPSYLTPGPGLRTDYFGSGKEHLDVCFVAHRYTADGSDKGWPVFLQSLSLLRETGVPVRGHVVGGFGRADVGAEFADLDLTFAPVLSTPQLREFYLGMDVIVSPTAPGRLAPGSFDGFPTGSCVEAALCGVALVATDPMDQNRLYTDGQDIHMPRADATDVVQRVLAMLGEPDGVRRVGQAGLRTTRRAYGVDAQLSSRRAVIEATRAAVADRRDRAPAPAREPLVSILVPTYNGERFIRAALRSALTQSHRTIEVLVGDDGSTDSTPEILASVAASDPRVRVIRHETNVGALENPRRLLAEARGEYVKYLMHDDVLATDCVRVLVRGMQSSPEVAMAFSHRALIDQDGRRVAGHEFPKLQDRPMILDARKLGSHVLRTCTNVIGEPTTVLFRRDDVRPEDLWMVDGRTVDVLNDVQLWLGLLAVGSAWYTPETLSRFRWHPGQNSHNPRYVGRAERDWSRLVDWGARNGFLREDGEEHRAQARALLTAANRVAQLVDTPDYGAALEAVHLSIARLTELATTSPPDPTRQLTERAHARPVLDRFTQELDVWTRVHPFALAFPALEEAEVAATVQALREIRQAQVAERLLIAVRSDQVERATLLVERALAQGPDVDLELVPTDGPPATLLRGPWLAVVRRGARWHQDHAQATWTVEPTRRSVAERSSVLS